MTTGMLRELLELKRKGYTDREVGRLLGISFTTASRWARRYLPEEERRRAQMRPKREYAIYDRKTSALLALGSPEECARALGVKRSSLYEMCARRGRKPNSRYIFVVGPAPRAGDIEEDEEG